MAEFVELYVDQGTTYNNIIYITDDVTNAAINVSNSTFTSQMRRSYASQNASGTFACTITDGPNGAVTLSMTSANTANIPYGRYLFDVKRQDGQGAISRVIEGIVNVTPRVTI